MTTPHFPRDSHLRARRVKNKDAAKSRAGWAEAARRHRERGDDGLLDYPFATEFDESEWVWEPFAQQAPNRSE